MSTVTIKSLQEQLNTSQEIRAEDNQLIAKLRAELMLANYKIADLQKDKDWLQRMHSAVLQSMHEFVRGRH